MQRPLLTTTLAVLVLTLSILSGFLIWKGLSYKADSNVQTADQIALDQSYDSTGGAYNNIDTSANDDKICQQFLPKQKEIFDYAELNIGIFSGSSFSSLNTTFNLQKDSNNTPGQSIYTAQNIIPDKLSKKWIRYPENGSAGIKLSLNTPYWLCLETNAYDTNFGVGLQWTTSADYGGSYPDGVGMIHRSGNWITPRTDFDLNFKEYGHNSNTVSATPTPASTTTPSPVSTNRSTTTTNRITTPTPTTSQITSTPTPSANPENANLTAVANSTSDNSLTVNDEVKIYKAGKVESQPIVNNNEIRKTEILHLNGTAKPNSIITFTIHSDTISQTTTANSQGEWSIDLNPEKLNLSSGQHTVLAYATDTSGNKSKEITVANFQIVNEQNKPVKTSWLKDHYLLIGSAALIVIIGIVIFIFLRHKNKLSVQNDNGGQEI